METIAMLLTALGGAVGIGSNVIVFRSLACVPHFWRSGWFVLFLTGYVVALACFLLAIGLTLPTET